MGRPRENRRVVTYSLAKITIDRIEELRDWKQRKLARRPSRVTYSEVIDDAIRELNSRAFADEYSGGDPTHGGRFNPEWIDSPKWNCPYCIGEGVQPDLTPLIVGGALVCPFATCRKPRPEASYPEGLFLSDEQIAARDEWIANNPPETDGDN